MQTVKCKTCDGEIILGNKEDLAKWEDKGGICSRCHKTKELRSLVKRKQTEKRKQEEKRLQEIQEEFKELKTVDEKETLFKEKFERLLELRGQYFDFLYGKERNEGVIKEIDDFFGVDSYEVFDYYEREFCEFFEMGEDGDTDLTWDKLLDMIKKHKKDHRD